MSRKKAQAEIALILGLLAVAAIVGVYSYSSLTAPSTTPVTISEEQKSVDSYIRDAIFTASMKTLSKIYTQGGYYDSSVAGNKLDFMNNDIAYWQICDETEIPDIEQEVSKGVTDYMKNNLPERTSVAGRQIEFRLQEIQTTARVYDNKITLSVNIPATVDGSSIPLPIVVDVESKLGRIHNFAKDFSEFQKTYRVLDQNLLEQMNLSNPMEEEDGTCWLPTVGLSWSTISKSWTGLKGCMEEHIIYTLTRTLEWQKPWIGPEGFIPAELMSNSYIFQIKKSDGSWGQYADLEVEFYYGGTGNSRTLSRNQPDFYFMTDPDPAVFTLIGIPGVISFVNYEVKYDVSFPVVISVPDEILQKTFNFVTFVNIRDSYPSNEGCMSDIVPDPTTVMCENTQGTMKLTVQDTDGQPLSGAYVSFGPCNFQYPTGVDGKLEIPIPHLDGTKELKIISGDTIYSVPATVQELASADGKVVKMPINRAYDMHFYVAYMHDSTIEFKDSLSAVKKIDASMTADYGNNEFMEDYAYPTFKNRKTDNVDWENVDENTPIDEIEEMTNHATAVLASKLNYEVVVSLGEGSSYTDASFELDADAGDIYIYAPIIVDGVTVSDPVGRMKNCGFSVISHKKPADITGGSSIISCSN